MGKKEWWETETDEEKQQRMRDEAQARHDAKVAGTKAQGEAAVKPKPHAALAPLSADYTTGQEQDLVDAAVKAGYSMSDEFLSGKEALGMATQKGTTAMAQMAARGLLGAMPFGGAGGAPLMQASATALATQAAQAELEAQSIQAQTSMGVGGYDALQAASEYDMSALPGVRSQQKIMGYMSAWYDMRDGLSKDQAIADMLALMAGETDQAVIDQMRDFMVRAE